MDEPPALPNTSKATRVLLTVLRVVVCIGFTGAVGFEIWSADQCHQSQNCGSYQAPSATSKEHSFDFALWYPADAVGLYTMVLAIFTGALVVVSGWQGYFLLRADRTARTAADAALTTANTAIIQAGHLESSVAEAKRAADEMANVAAAMTASAKSAAEANVVADRSARVVNRAYAYFVLKDDTCRDFLIGVAKSIRFTWHAQNFGKTPASLVGAGSGVAVGEAFPLPFPFRDSERFMKRVILAESEISDEFDERLGRLSEDDVSAIMLGNKRVWFAGWFAYTDIFGTIHTTCWGYGYDRDRGTLSREGVPPSFNINT